MTTFKKPYFEEVYERAVDQKGLEIRRVQLELANSEPPCAFDYGYRGDEKGKAQLLSALTNLANKWGEGAAKLQSIDTELKALNEERDEYYDPICIERLDVAINTMFETKAKIEGVVAQVAELELDPTDKWTDDAQELIENLAFPLSPLRLYDWRGLLPMWYGFDLLYPTEEHWVWAGRTDRKKPSWSAIVGNPVSGFPAWANGLVKKIVRLHGKALKRAFEWTIIVVALVLFPSHPAYSYGVLIVGVAANCHWKKYWGDFIEQMFIWAAVYGVILFLQFAVPIWLG